MPLSPAARRCIPPSGGTAGLGGRRRRPQDQKSHALIHYAGWWRRRCACRSESLPAATASSPVHAHDGLAAYSDSRRRVSIGLSTSLRHTPTVNERLLSLTAVGESAGCGAAPLRLDSGRACCPTGSRTCLDPWMDQFRGPSMGPSPPQQWRRRPHGRTLMQRDGASGRRHCLPRTQPADPASGNVGRGEAAQRDDATVVAGPLYAREPRGNGQGRIRLEAHLGPGRPRSRLLTTRVTERLAATVGLSAPQPGRRLAPGLGARLGDGERKHRAAADARGPRRRRWRRQRRQRRWWWRRWRRRRQERAIGACG